VPKIKINAVEKQGKIVPVMMSKNVNIHVCAPNEEIRKAKN
jgi:hypothetical protein